MKWRNLDSLFSYFYKVHKLSSRVEMIWIDWLVVEPAAQLLVGVRDCVSSGLAACFCRCWIDGVQQTLRASAECFSSSFSPWHCVCCSALLFYSLPLLLAQPHILSSLLSLSLSAWLLYSRVSLQIWQRSLTVWPYECKSELQQLHCHVSLLFWHLGQFVLQPWHL